MYTKEDLKEYLKAMGLTGKETILGTFGISKNGVRW